MTRPACVSVVLACLVVAPLPAQNRSLLEFYQADRARLSAVRFARPPAIAGERGAPASQPLGALAPLEGAVDPGEYLVGPGDIFGVTVGGLEPAQGQVAVTSDGHLTLPNAGTLLVAGETLAAVRARAVEALRSSFENVPVDVTLSQPRAFFVHVSGAVPEPGRYRAAPVARVEDVLEEAFFSERFGQPVTNPAFRPALRNVVVVGRDGGRRAVDLVRYYRTGDVGHNPYLRDGDAITVPAFRPSEDGVFVGGEVPFPGTYDHRPGDTVLDLLAVAGGADAADGIAEVRLRRRGAGGEAAVYRVADLAAPGATPVPVGPGDNLHVPAPDTRPGIATVVGYVRFPGSFPIEEGRTTLGDLVSMAGGFRDDALVRGAYLERGVVPDEGSPEERLRDSPDPLPILLTDTSSVLRQMRLSDLDFLSRYDLARALRLENRVSVDVAAAAASDDGGVPLFDGDRLVVPRDEGSVRVIGEVVRPGAVGVLDRGTAEGYVDAAGGRGPGAGGTYVIRAGTGQVVPGAGSDVRSGDVVFVDREGGTAATVEQERLALQDRDVGIRKFQLVLQAVGTVLSVVTTTLLVANAIGN